MSLVQLLSLTQVTEEILSHKGWNHEIMVPITRGSSVTFSTHCLFSYPTKKYDSALRPKKSLTARKK